MPNQIEKDIYKTLSYFAFFQYPVTSLEVYNWMINPAEHYSFMQVEKALQGAWLSACMQEKNGFYALGDVKRWYEQRQLRFLDAMKKQKKAHHYIAFLKRIPSIRFVGLCNSLPFYFTQPESDIDVFIITNAGTLWSTRLSSVGPLIAFRQRPGEILQSPIDCSFFLNGDCAGLEQVKIGKEDPYLAVWARSIVPVYEREEGEFKRFLAENSWASAYLPHSRVTEPKKIAKKPLIQLPIRFSERFARWLQMKKMPLRIKMLSKEGTEIVMNNKMLKFHLNDRRQEVKDFMQKELCKIKS